MCQRNHNTYLRNIMWGEKEQVYFIILKKEQEVCQDNPEEPCDREVTLLIRQVLYQDTKHSLKFKDIETCKNNMKLNC